jgi:AcrR family transcriptional regulator
MGTSNAGDAADTGPERARRLSRAEAKARTREQLLEAAARAFARKGFAGASVEEIAESAGYSIGALYSNFASKEALFLELLSARARQRAVFAAEIVGGEDRADPVGALSQFLVRIADTDGDFGQLQAEFWLYAVRNPGAMEAFAAQQRELAGAIESLVGSAMERAGVIPQASPGEVTTLVLAMFQGLVRRRRIEQAAVPAELFAQGLRWLFAGLRATADGRQALGRL